MIYTCRQSQKSKTRKHYKVNKIIMRKKNTLVCILLVKYITQYESNGRKLVRDKNITKTK